MTEQASAKPRTRQFYLDNLRIYLTILVILHHAALAYGGAGNWSVKDPTVDDISPIFLLFFNAVNQTYFMSAFFFSPGISRLAPLFITLWAVPLLKVWLAMAGMTGIPLGDRW